MDRVLTCGIDNIGARQLVQLQCHTVSSPKARIAGAATFIVPILKASHFEGTSDNETYLNYFVEVRNRPHKVFIRYI